VLRRRSSRLTYKRREKERPAPSPTPSELLELRDDVGFEERWAELLRLAVQELATPEVFGEITPKLLRRMRNTFAGEAA
jgi:hypothetical protein